MDKLKIIEKNNPFPESTFRTKSRQICSAAVYTIETKDKVYAGSSKCIKKE